MRVLAFDPGAERMGWAAVQRQDDGVYYSDSGISGLPRNKMDYQEYKLDLIRYWLIRGQELLDWIQPELVVNEIVPAVGGGNFIAATQSELAKTAITAVQVLTLLRDIPVVQIGATTVKKKIGGSNKATKVKVRNGVVSLIPELEPRLPEWRRTQISDETDAIAIALAYLGFEVK